MTSSSNHQRPLLLWQEDIIQNILGHCDGKVIGRLESTCRSFCFGDEEASLCEVAAAAMVQGLLPPGQRLQLQNEEDWKIVCHLAHGMLARGEDPQQVR